MDYKRLVFQLVESQGGNPAWHYQHLTNIPMSSQMIYFFTKKSKYIRFNWLSRSATLNNTKGYYKRGWLLKPIDCQRPNLLKTMREQPLELMGWWVTVRDVNEFWAI